MSAIRIAQVGTPPEALRGWPLEWITDPQTGARWLTCAGLRLGYLTAAQLAAASPVAQLEIVIDWQQIAMDLEIR